MSDRANKGNPTGLSAYFEAINEIFALQTKVLTGALPHYGERGRNDEQRVTKLLEQVLPRRFSLGTGFVLSSHSDLAASPQMDIIIHDEIYNSPLFRELAANIFPIEAVYGTVEVKADLSLVKLREAAAALALIRQMAKRGKFYALHGIAEDAVRSDSHQPQGFEIQIPSKLAPRAFIVGYDADAATPEGFGERLTVLLSEQPGIFLHGVYAIKQNWFFFQEYGRNTFKQAPTNGLLAMTSKLISDLQSFPMKPMAFSRYVQNEVLREATQVQETGNETANK